MTEQRQAPASLRRRGYTTVQKKRAASIWATLVSHVLPENLDWRAACRDKAIARRPNNRLSLICGAERRELGTQSPARNGLEQVDKVTRPDLGRHVDKSVNMVTLAGAFEHRALPRFAERA